MATLTIHNLEDDIEDRLREHAARHGRSIEEEARSILQAARPAAEQPAGSGAALVQAIRAHVARYGGVELELPPRTPMCEPPDFSGSEFGE